MSLPVYSQFFYCWILSFLSVVNQLREMEAELEEERKQRTMANNARKKLEGDFKNMQEQVDSANKIKEEAVGKLRRLQVPWSDNCLSIT